MVSGVLFYCGSSDIEALTDYIQSLGLIFVAPIMNQKLEEENFEGPFFYISIIPKSELNPYGDPPLRISDATDPFIDFSRGYFKDPYLVLGHICVKRRA